MTASVPLADYLDPEIVKAAIEVKRVRYEGRATLAACVRERQPVILEGGLEAWPAMSAWTLDYFMERWGDRSIQATRTSFTKGTSPYQAKAAQVHATEKLRDCLTRMRRDDPADPVYLNQNDADAAYPGSRDDLRYEDMVDGAASLRPNVWMGTRGTRSGLHWDGADNLIAMLRGSKVFLLSPAGSYRKLYGSRENASKSRIDPARVDWRAFPRLRDATLLAGVLRRGELLFLPMGWWHYFSATELSINASIWFGSQFRARPFHQYGPSHVAAFTGQFFWHGVLQQPYEQHALSPPPLGLAAYKAVIARLEGHRQRGSATWRLLNLAGRGLRFAAGALGQRRPTRDPANSA